MAVKGGAKHWLGDRRSLFEGATSYLTRYYSTTVSLEPLSHDCFTFVFQCCFLVTRSCHRMLSHEVRCCDGAELNWKKTSAADTDLWSVWDLKQPAQQNRNLLCANCPLISQSDTSVSPLLPLIKDYTSVVHLLIKSLVPTSLPKWEYEQKQWELSECAQGSGGGQLSSVSVWHLSLLTFDVYYCCWFWFNPI